MHKATGILAVSVLLVSLVLPVSAQHAEHYEQEPNNNQWEANPVTMQSSVVGNAPLGDVDYFALPTPDYLATYGIQVQVYTPHPPLPCNVEVRVQNAHGRGAQITGRNPDYKYTWTGLDPVYYISIRSECSNLHYQIDFSRVRGAYRTYLPVAR